LALPALFPPGLPKKRKIRKEIKENGKGIENKVIIPKLLDC
jgi:hypothetical protein